MQKCVLRAVNKGKGRGLWVVVSSSTETEQTDQEINIVCVLLIILQNTHSESWNESGNNAEDLEQPYIKNSGCLKGALLYQFWSSCFFNS